MEELLIIVGPTAVGKTELAISLAEELNAEIISADSMQVYKGMDIGTAKPTATEHARVPHHMIDVADPREEFSAGRYLKLAEEAIADIRGRGKEPLVVGGTGLYIKALTDGLFEGPSADFALREELMEKERVRPGSLHEMLLKSDPDAASRMHPSDLRRIIRALEVYKTEGRPISRVHEEHKAQVSMRAVRMAGLRRNREELYKRIDERVDAMMSAGFLDEVKGLRDMGCARDMVSMQALGYKQALAYMDGETTLDEAVRLIKRDTRRYAKRQFTWFNAEPRIRWVDLAAKDTTGEAMDALKKALEIFGDLS